MKNPKIRRENVVFFIEKAKTLALPYEEQYKLLHTLEDYIAHDIAGDWIWNDLGNGVVRMFDQNLIDNNALILYKEIDKTFWDISLDGPSYDEEFWTLNGLKKHPIWEKQRERARELLNILEKIEC